MLPTGFRGSVVPLEIFPHESDMTGRKPSRAGMRRAKHEVSSNIFRHTKNNIVPNAINCAEEIDYPRNSCDGQIPLTQAVIIAIPTHIHCLKPIAITMRTAVSGHPYAYFDAAPGYSKTASICVARAFS